MKKAILVVAGMLAYSGISWGLGDNNTVVLNNTVGFAWNDNYTQLASNKVSTGIISESPEVVLNLVSQNTYFGFRYRPSLLWFTSDEVQRRQTVQHELNASLNQFFSQRLSLMLNETLRRGVQPEILDRNNALIAPDASFIENTVNGVLGVQLRSSTRLDLSGRYYIMKYDDTGIASNDYNIATAGVSLRQDVSKATTVSGNFNYDSTSYSRVDARSSSTASIGVGVDHSFNPRLLGSASGGYQLRSFDASFISGQNSPYGNLSVTYIFDPRLRLTVGANYSLWEANITPYASQERLTGYLALGYDITSRIQISLTGGLTRGKYNAEQVYNDSTTAVGGTDNLYQAAARVAYQINRHNWVDASYGYNRGVSDFRSDFDVNSFNVSWRLSY